MYEAIVVLGGGLQKRGEQYFPADYSDSDEFGMLGGDMRLIAACALFTAARSTRLVFTTGVYQKNVAKFGADVPPEADVYARRFRELLREQGTQTEQYEIVLENTSTTTLTNLQEVIRLINERAWKRVAIVTNDYHVARVSALLETLRSATGVAAIEVLSAEKTVKELAPGTYDAEIDAAYATPEAAKRIESERRGVADIASGTYAQTEFQLAKRDA